MMERLREGWDLLAVFAASLFVEWQLRGVLAVAGAVLAQVMGAQTAALNALLALMVLDFALGFARAWLEGALSRAKLVCGLAKFMLYGGTISCFHLLDVGVGGGLFGYAARDVVAIPYLCVTESLSVLDHLSRFGAPVPKGVVARLKNFRDGGFCKLKPHNGEARP